ncbi:unnamed protein product [Caenorhabditis nigoni]
MSPPLINYPKNYQSTPANVATIPLTFPRSINQPPANVINYLKNPKLATIFRNVYHNSARTTPAIASKTERNDPHPEQEKIIPCSHPGRPYRVPANYQAELEKHINSLLKSVKKKNGSLRVCLDFRKLNDAAIPDHFPLPRIDAILEKVGDASYFSSLDMANGYLQLRLDPASSYKCGFVTESKVYAYNHLPFGRKSAASYFQRALRSVLGGLAHEALVYIDDILIFSTNFE